MPDRTISPATSPLSVPDILPHNRQELPNGTEIIYIHDENQEVFKMDVIFEAGGYYQSQPLIAPTAINMLNEGTRFHNAEEIAETFDYYGAYADFNCGMHKAEVNLISLNKYAAETITMLSEMTHESIFPPKELEIHLRNKRQQFLVDVEKNSWLARKEFARILFGASHPYANTVTENDYKQVNREAIQNFYAERIRSGWCRIVLSGNISDTVLKTTEKAFGTSRPSPENTKTSGHLFQPEKPGRYDIYKENSVQSSLRIGKTGVSLTHEDYAGFQLLNTVLGGYFGSRLMSNIREEKGYTYGINSFNVNMPLASYWCIATDVNKNQTEATIAETLKEIKTLQKKLIPANELALVKNFFHGDLLREIDGVFSQADALKHKLNYGIDNYFYVDIINRIRNCTARELRELANKYLNTDDLYIVVAGEKPENL